MAVISERALIAEVEHRLKDKYAELPPDRISHAVRDAHKRFAHSRVCDFVHLLVERRAVAELPAKADLVAARG
jgi:hypothetical protein